MTEFESPRTPQQPTSPETQDKPQKSLLSVLNEGFSRHSRTIALYSALGTVATFGAAKWSEAQLKNETRETYGTFEDPRFTVQPIELEDGVSSLRDLIALTRPVKEDMPISVLLAEVALPDFKNTLDDLKSIVAQRSLDDTEFHRWRERFDKAVHPRVMELIEFETAHPRHAGVCSALAALGESAELNAVHLDLVALSHDVRELGRFEMRHREEVDPGLELQIGVSSLRYAHDLFSKVTGRPLPSNVRISFAEIAEPGVAGMAQPLGGQIVVEPCTYPQEISTLCHEMGHLVARPGEEFNQTRGFLLAVMTGIERDRSARVLEEASAYAFERVCAAAIEHPELRSAVARGFEHQLFLQTRAYFYGESDIHYEAGVLAAVATEVLGGPKQAFEYLSATREVSPEILRRIEDLRAEWGQLASIRCRDVARELKALSAQIDEIRERVDPTFKPK